METQKKGTKVYTRIQAASGREVTVRKRRGEFILFLENQETETFSTQAEAMQAADRLAEAHTPKG